MERKLATIELIKDILPIEGADFIELVKVRGWQCIAKKGEFKVGDKCIYFEVDSFLPEEPQYEFLRKSSFKKMGDKQGFRLRTIKLKGTLSQGLVLPLDDDHMLSKLSVGTDVTDLLGVEKYEKPIPANLSGVVKRYFPSFLIKTDQERVQNMTIEHINDKGIWTATEKLDGTSFTCYKYRDDYGVCSRNLELKETEDNLYWKIFRKYFDPELMPEGYCFQGEILGPGIQGNKYGLKEHKLFIFHIYNIDNKTYLEPEHLVDAVKTIHDELRVVPLIGDIDLSTSDVEDILAFAEGKSLIGDCEREGIVFYNKQHSFKAVSNSWLLKYKE